MPNVVETPVNGFRVGGNHFGADTNIGSLDAFALYVVASGVRLVAFQPDRRIVMQEGVSLLSETGYIGTPFGGFGRFSNLLKYSEDFSWVGWTKQGITVTANSHIAPDGTTTADTINASSTLTTTDHIRQHTVGYSVTSTTWTASVWLRVAAGTSSVRLRIDADSGAGDNHTVLLTTAWKRFSITQSFGVASTGSPIFVIENGINAVVAWGAQLEQAGSPGIYVKTIEMPVSTCYGLAVQSSGPHFVAGGNFGVDTNVVPLKFNVYSQSSQVNFRSAFTAHEGGSLTSRSASEGIMAGGAFWDGSQWVATTSDASLVACAGGRVDIYSNNSLSISGSFTPFKVISYAPGGAILQPQTYLRFLGQGSNRYASLQNVSGNLHFLTEDSLNDSPKMILTNGGRLLLGTTDTTLAYIANLSGTLNFTQPKANLYSRSDARILLHDESNAVWQGFGVDAGNRAWLRLPNDQMFYWHTQGASLNKAEGRAGFEIYNRRGTTASVPYDILYINSALSGVTPSAGFGPRMVFTAQTDNVNVHQDVAGIAGIWEDPANGGVDGAITFYTNRDQAGLAERMRLSANGNLGLGKTASYQLELSTDSAAKPGTSTWTVVSDRRLKSSGNVYNNSLLNLMDMPMPRWWWYNDASGLPTGEKFLGWVAQDINEIDSSLVTVSSGILHPSSGLNEIYNINYHNLQFLMLNSIKELSQRVDHIFNSLPGNILSQMPKKQKQPSPPPK